jgi:hypothetical protein
MSSEEQIRRRIRKHLDELERSAWAFLVNGDQEARGDKRQFVGLGEKKAAALVQRLWDFAALTTGGEPEWAALPEEEQQTLRELLAQDFAPGPGFDDDRFLGWHLVSSLAAVVRAAREIRESLGRNELLEALDSAVQGLMTSPERIVLTWLAGRQSKGKRGRPPEQPGAMEETRAAWKREQSTNPHPVRKKFVARRAQELGMKPATVDRWLSCSHHRSNPA